MEDCDGGIREGKKGSFAMDEGILEVERGGNACEEDKVSCKRLLDVAAEKAVVWREPSR